jgi:hypothetical protein
MGEGPERSGEIAISSGGDNLADGPLLDRSGAVNEVNGFQYAGSMASPERAAVRLPMGRFAPSSTRR